MCVYIYTSRSIHVHTYIHICLHSWVCIPYRHFFPVNHRPIHHSGLRSRDIFHIWINLLRCFLCASLPRCPHQRDHPSPAFPILTISPYGPLSVLTLVSRKYSQTHSYSKSLLFHLINLALPGESTNPSFHHSGPRSPMWMARELVLSCVLAFFPFLFRPLFPPIIPGDILNPMSIPF